MGDITRNLSRHEFECKDGCGLSEPHPVLVVGVQRVVNMTPGCRGVIITSGSRCREHQLDLVRRGVSTARASWHLPRPDRGGYTLAADCIFLGVEQLAALVTAQKLPEFAFGGLGVYVGATCRLHLDVRGTRARWGSVFGANTSFDAATAALEKHGKVQP